MSQLNDAEKGVEQIVKMAQYSLSVFVPWHFVVLADCTTSGYVGGQVVPTGNMSSFYLFITKIVQS